jgi:hypothetical protein
MDLKMNIPTDHVGIFHDKHRFRGNSSYTWFFYATTNGQYPLTTEKKWFECIVDAEELLNKVVTRKELTETKNTTKNLLENHQTTPSKKRKLSSPVRLRTSEKRQLMEDLSSSCISASSSSSVHHCPCTTAIHSTSYWDSPEARKLFRVHDDEETQQSIRMQIETLMKANRTESSYIEVVYGGEKLEDDSLSKFEKHLIRQKSQLLCLSLNLALENMNKWTWNKCCGEAIERAKKMGVTIA